MLASLVSLRGALADDPFEAIVVQPAFDMYGACADALAGGSSTFRRCRTSSSRCTV